MFCKVNMRLWLPVIAAIVLAISYCKGIEFLVMPWGEPYAFLTYKHGIIKRAVVGQILAWLFEGSAVWKLKMAFLQMHYLLSLLIAYLLFYMMRRVETINPEHTTSLWLAMILCGASFFWPTLAYNPGYLDVYEYALLMLCIAAYFTKRFCAASILCAIAPFLHESALFVWSPIYVLVAWGCIKQRRFLWKEVTPLVVLFASTVLLLVLHSNEASVLEMQAAVLQPGVAEGMIKTQLGQTFSSSIDVMMGLWRWHYGHAFCSIMYFGWPSAVIVALYLASRRVTIPDSVVLFVAALIPLSILICAWDLSRFVVFTNLAALIVVLWWEFYYRPEARPLRCSTYMLAPLIVLLVMMPNAYTYFHDVYFQFDRGLFPTQDTWAGMLAVGLLSQGYDVIHLH